MWHHRRHKRIRISWTFTNIIKSVWLQNTQDGQILRFQPSSSFFGERKSAKEPEETLLHPRDWQVDSSTTEANSKKDSLNNMWDCCGNHFPSSPRSIGKSRLKESLNALLRIQAGSWGKFWTQVWARTKLKAPRSTTIIGWTRPLVNDLMISSSLF